MPAKTERRVGLKEVRESAKSLLEAGRPDEALEYLLAAIDSLLQKNGDLELLVAKLRRERLGTRSEKIDPAQLTLLFDALARQTPAGEEVEPVVGSPAEREITSEIEAAREDERESRRRSKKKRRDPELTRGIPQAHHQKDVPEVEKNCDGCGKPKRRLGEDVSRSLEYIPGHFVEHVHHLAKYTCSGCKDGVTTAPGPAKILPRSAAGASLLAHVVVSKFADHTPLHRLSRIYRRGGGLFAVSTLSDWVAGVADMVQPVVDRLVERVMAAHVLGTDATGLKVLDPDSPENIQRGTMWCGVGDGLDVVFWYTPTGEGETGPWDFLAGRKGYIQADAANVFDRLFNGKVASAVEVGCWSHARRRFEALKDTDCRVAHPLALINRLFRVEELADLRHVDPDGRVALRQKWSVDALAQLQRWLVLTQGREPPSSQLAKATAYVLNHWQALNRFLEDGRLRVDNNLVEQQLRDVALGRKNFLFAGSHDAARRIATLYSLMRTCAQHDVPPLLYVTDILGKLAGAWPQERLDELLPDRWQALHSATMSHPFRQE